MAVNIWNERTAKMRKAETIEEAAREYVEWLDYIVGSKNDGETSAEDFDALYERWVFSGAWKRIAEEAPRLQKELDRVSDLALAVFTEDESPRVWNGFYDSLDRCFALIDGLDK